MGAELLLSAENRHRRGRRDFFSSLLGLHALGRAVERLLPSHAGASCSRRPLRMVQDEAGRVARLLLPAAGEPSRRAETDAFRSRTPGHHEPGDAGLAEPETLLESRTANQIAHRARIEAPSPETAAAAEAGWSARTDRPNPVLSLRSWYGGRTGSAATLVS